MFCWCTICFLLFSSRYPLPEKPRQKRAVIQDMVRPLKKWLLRHRHNPYPTKAEKVHLALGSNMTLVQVSNQKVNIIAAIICHNNELSSSLSLSWLEIVYNSVFWLSATRYMKANRIGWKEILRRIWLISAKKIKPSESIPKQSSQVKLELNSSKLQIIVAELLSSLNVDKVKKI